MPEQKRPKSGLHRKRSHHMVAEDIKFPQNAFQWHMLISRHGSIAGKEFYNLIFQAELAATEIIEFEEHLALQSYQVQQLLEKKMEFEFEQHKEELDRAKLVRNRAEAQLKDEPVAAKDKEALGGLYVEMAVLGVALVTNKNEQEKLHQKWFHTHAEHASNVLS